MKLSLISKQLCFSIISRISPFVKGRLLVVDDEPDITEVLKVGLEKEGFEVNAFTRPLEALEQFKPGQYDMVMLDVRMPDIDGFSLYEKLKAIDNRIKVTFMTAFDVAYLDMFQEKFPFLPEKAYIKKPLTIRSLVKLLRSELRIID
jgi:DNA-binding response OmpR family regulator